MKARAETLPRVGDIILYPLRGRAHIVEVITGIQPLPGRAARLHGTMLKITIRLTPNFRRHERFETEEYFRAMAPLGPGAWDGSPSRRGEADET